MATPTHCLCLYCQSLLLSKESTWEIRYLQDPCGCHKQIFWEHTTDNANKKGQEEEDYHTEAGEGLHGAHKWQAY